jgi:ATP-dependent helicase/nuclease subunit B
MDSPRVFTIPASAPFMPTLIKALLDGTLVTGFPAALDPLALTRATIYLPTRRACRLARDLFLDVTGTEAAILPRIVPIGDIDEDEIVFAQAATGPVAAKALELPPALSNLDRQLFLAQLIALWAAAPQVRGESRTPLVATHPAAALALAGDLARLMDDMTTRQVSWDRLDDLVPDHLDEYWRMTLRFLEIARANWPAILAERGAMEPAARRDKLIEAETERLKTRIDGPVIAAGSTGSMPATAALIASIARLPHGAVVLPGLDTDLDEPSWNRIAGGGDGNLPAVTHPQYAMRALLERIGITREEVATLVLPARIGRERLASEAFRPAVTTDLWRTRATDAEFAAQAEAALAALALIEAANPEEEALAIAVSLREAVEMGKTAALVTPDRALARRVLASLARWNIAADDSGGDSLGDTPAGIFARLAAEASITGLPPVSLLALLKHPLTRLGQNAHAHDRAIASLERAILRGPRPAPGTDGLRNALATFREELAKLKRRERSDLHPSEPRARLSEVSLEAAANLVVELVAALAPLEALRTDRTHSLAALSEHHRTVIAALSEDGSGMPTAFTGPDGTALAALFDEIGTSRAAASFQVALAEYPDVFEAAASGRVVRRPGSPGVRVRILGLLESRLTMADRVILGGLNEGSWPPEARSDAWLSRPMRHALGLDLPERRISLSAHDFAQLLGAPEVILARAAKAAGAPTVASRFVQRLAAVAGEHWEGVRRRGERYRQWAGMLDRPSGPPKRAPRPTPRPPVAARPLTLSVTEVEHWLRDPYTIYAKYILDLRELDPVDLVPGAADRGTLIHGALSEFTTTFATALPEDPERELIEIGRRHFAAMENFPEARAFWWPRFMRIARWFAGWETERRARMAAIKAETSGAIEIPLGERIFKLRARADRIERLPDGRYAILDYKTGAVPSEKQVRIGISPQLTLEAAILRGGGFADIPPGGSVEELVYVALKGRSPAGESARIEFKQGDPDFHAHRALEKLKGVALRFENPEQPYLPLVLSMWKTRYGTYDHLARVKEWSVAGDDDEAEAGE